MGGSKAPGESTTTTQLSPQQEALMSMGMPLVSNFTNAVTSGNVNVPQPAGFTPEQTQGQQMVLNAGPQMAATSQSAASGNQWLTGGGALDVKNNPALPGYIDTSNQALDRAFKMNVIPGLRTDAVNAGALGSPKDTSRESAAASDYLLQRGNNTNDILNNAYNSGLGATVTGIGQSPQITSGLAVPGGAVEAVGAEKQNLTDAQNAATFAQQQLPLTVATQLFSSLAGLPGAGSTVQNTPAKPQGLLGWLFG